MEVKEFIDTCVDNGYAWSQGKQEGTDGYFIGCKDLDTAAHFSVDAIEKNDWPALEKQIVQGKNVHHVSRIVGYYSRIENWNKSKQGELKGRHEGDYRIEK